MTSMQRRKILVVFSVANFVAECLFITVPKQAAVNLAHKLTMSFNEPQKDSACTYINIDSFNSPKNRQRLRMRHINQRPTRVSIGVERKGSEIFYDYSSYSQIYCNCASTFGIPKNHLNILQNQFYIHSTVECRK